MSSQGRLTVREILDDPLVNRIQSAAASAAAKTKPVQKRRNSLAGFANMVLQAISLSAFLLADSPVWVVIAVGVVGFVAEIIVHATSKTPVTGAVVEQVTEEAREQSVQQGLSGLPEAPAPRYSLFR